ncbi:MAG: DEAD/DEAH box helicase [Candidatus Gastranaerophilaceae bacterium]
MLNKKTPFELFDKLKNTYIDYIETQDFINSKSVSDERHEMLISSKSGLFQEPYLEPIIKYQFSTSLENDIKDDDLREFLQYPNGLFPKNEKDPSKSYRLYTHQKDALKEDNINKHIIVTTGTGSGKTETFLLPVIRNLLKEAKTWQKSEIKENNWKLLKEAKNSDVKLRIKRGEFLQRYGENPNRQAAVRSMIMYPLNALVDDQLIRLRKVFNSKEAKKFMEKNCNGNKIYFGRYTGDTPLAGISPITNDEKSKLDINRINRLKDELVKIEDVSRAKFRNADYEEEVSEGKYFVQSLDGAEMYSRWDMQEYPPDILITNYSMLNIMLMRKIEDNIFEKTKKWLQSNPENKFQLIIDELHSYRGTQGTEIAYLIREFLDRIGLTPDSEQLQILASTASLGDNDEESRQFLKDFFGVSDGKKFEILKGKIEIPDKNAKYNLKNYDKYEQMSNEEREISLEKDNIIEFLKNAFFDVTQNKYIAKPISRIAEENNLEEIVVKKLIEAITISKAGEEKFPIRVHYLFKNFRGLWACTNPNCPESKKNKEPEKYTDDKRNFGKLYMEPKTVCSCGSRVLELLHCNVCGDTYFGGYTTEQENNQKEFYLFPESSNIEKLPEFCNSEKSSKNYIVFNPEKEPETTQEAIKLKHYGKKAYTRQGAYYNDKTGMLRLGCVADANVEAYIAEEKGNWTALPFTCSHCSTTYNNTHSENLEYPIVKAYTHGAQKINQILIDTLLREQNKRNIIVFTDSRQDAAKLSAGVEIDHYRDTIRQMTYEVISDAENDLKLFVELSEKRNKTDEEKTVLKNLKTKIRKENLDLYLYYYDLDFKEENPDKLPEIEKIIAEAKDGNTQLQKLTDIKTKISDKLLNLGINPGGYVNNVYELKQKDINKPDIIRWKQVYKFSDNKYIGKENNSEYDTFRNSIEKALTNELLEVIFNKKNGLEALGIATVTFNREGFINKYKKQTTEDVEKNIQLLDSIIKIYGEKKIYGVGKINLDTNAKSYIAKFLGEKEVDNEAKEFIKTVLDVLTDLKILTVNGKDNNEYSLNPDELYIIPFNKNHDKIHQCKNCKRIGINPSNNICIDKKCKGKTFFPIESVNNKNNFYYKLANETPYKLTSEELTAQTSKDAQKRRQRCFQDIYLDTECPLTDSIEMLSVTTTMEAGVDIGALESVVMANMPPQRFNYQQRVGRAGRRNQALAVALTVCRTRSHDEYYFKNPDKVTNEIPPAPYLDLRSEQIFERFVIKEILRHALKEQNYNSENGKDVHGEFGMVEDWNSNREQVQNWISNNNDIIRNIIQDLAIGTPHINCIDKFAANIGNNLIQKIDESKNKFQTEFEQMGELLANAGLLPMFGFPTRERDLIIEQKNFYNNIMPDRNSVITRDLDIAISQFSPCGETVKDKKIYMALGIKSELLDKGTSRKFVVCPKCKNLKEITDDYDSNKILCEYCSYKGDIVEAVQPDSFFTAGYLSAHNKPIDYDGHFEYTPYSSRPQINCSERIALTKQIENYSCLENAQLVQIISVNDNNGNIGDDGKKGFNFQKYINKDEVVWVSAEAQEKYTAIKEHCYTYGFDKTDEVKKIALISSKMTDVFLMEMTKIPDKINLRYDIENIYSKSAYYSFAFLLRDAVAKHLDIDRKEIQVGLKSTRRDDYGTTAQIFLSDSIENGAGYSKWLSEKSHGADNIKIIMDKILSDEYMSFYTDENHINNCDSSCYGCLQDYANLHYHGLLNWRLAYDMAKMMCDKTYIPNLNESYWKTLRDTSLLNLFNFIKSLLKEEDRKKVILIEDETKVIYNGREFYLVHPLWKTSDYDGKIYINILDVIKRPNIVQDKITSPACSVNNSNTLPTIPITIKKTVSKKGPGGSRIKPKETYDIVNYTSCIEAFESLQQSDDTHTNEKNTISDIIKEIIAAEDKGFTVEIPAENVPLEDKCKNTVSQPVFYWSNSKVALFLQRDEAGYSKTREYNVYCFCLKQITDVADFVKHITENEEK